MRVEAKSTKNIGTFKINGEEYDVFIAKSEEQKKQGLQNFKSLPKDEGMLFVINEDEPVETSFHMHNVPFPLDMIFMDEDFKVLDVKRGNPEDDQIKGIASYVLELNVDSKIKKDDEGDLDEPESNYVMHMLAPDGSVQFSLFGGERIFSRKSTKSFIRKAIKAERTKEDKDYKALGRAIFKELQAQDNRQPEYVNAPEGKEDK